MQPVLHRSFFVAMVLQMARQLPHQPDQQAFVMSMTHRDSSVNANAVFRAALALGAGLDALLNKVGHCSILLAVHISYADVNRVCAACFSMHRHISAPAWLAMTPMPVQGYSRIGAWGELASDDAPGFVERIKEAGCAFLKRMLEDSPEADLGLAPVQ